MGAMTAGGGLFLFLWYRTVVSLPAQRQPLFIRPAAFKWGIPALSLLLFAAGTYLLASVSLWAAGWGAALAGLAAFLLLKFDRYSAVIRAIHGRYLNIRKSNEGMEEMEVLYHLAQWRYPEWDHDRIVELVAGKDIRDLILLILIRENDIHPIGDWELYRSLKAKVIRLTRIRA